MPLFAVQRILGLVEVFGRRLSVATWQLSRAGAALGIGIMPILCGHWRRSWLGRVCLGRLRRSRALLAVARSGRGPADSVIRLAPHCCGVQLVLRRE